MLTKIVLSVFSLIALLSVTSPVFAISEEEKSFLSLYFKEEELEVLSATRSLKSITRVSKNVEVVTAEDIEIMNAHTVAGAVYNVTGIELINYKGPGSASEPSIHGSDLGRVAVFMDGVPLQNANNSVPLAILPVQMVRKIEIIKGPASAVWGSSFGGVINIITKAAEEAGSAGGMVYAAAGEGHTSDLRADVMWRKDRLGVYLYGGTMNSGGVLPGHEFWHNNLYSRVSVEAGQETRLDFSFFYHRDDSLNIDFSPLGRDAYNVFSHELLYGRAGLQAPLARDIVLNISAWASRQNGEIYENKVSTGARLGAQSSIFDRYGLSGNLEWRAGLHTVVAGTDILYGRFTQDSISTDVHKLRKYAFFVNDTISMNKLTITPGLRYDYTNLGGDMVSPSLGLTYLAAKDLLFRAVVSRGFHDPAITKFLDAPGLGFYANTELQSEKIWSYQAGVEATFSELLWTRLTLFHHDIDDLIIEQPLGPRRFSAVNGGKARSTGGEFDISTKKYLGLVLKGGAHYEHIKLIDFSSPRYFDVSNVYGINASFEYNNDKGLRAMLKGHYMWWNRTDFYMGKYNGFVVDFNIIKEVLKKKDSTVDVFFTANNILNVSSYNEILHRNPGRWIEAGVRYKF